MDTDKYEGFKINAGQIRDINSKLREIQAIYKETQRDLSNVMAMNNLASKGEPNCSYTLGELSYGNRGKKLLEDISIIIENCTDSPLAALDTFK